MSVPPREPQGPRDPQDALWQAIVDNYGERPAWEEPVAAPAPERDEQDRRVHRDEPDDHAWAPEHPDLARGPEERYVPPPPPPIPRTTPVRFLAWFGLLGVPSLVLLATVLRVRLPPWADTLLLVWFVSGFVLLVASMRRDRPHPDDDPDHGAVL